MLTAKQERFCQNLEIKKMSQRKAYLDAFPASAHWKPSTVDAAACRLAKEYKISARREELRKAENDFIKQEAKWTRTDAFRELDWLIQTAKEEIKRGELTGPCVSAVINAVKELNHLFHVNEKQGGHGALEDILNAVKGVMDD